AGTNRWHVGPLALLGDAAHAMSPVLAVGAAMAMEDAWVLADEIVRAGDAKSALTTYVERRKPRVQLVQQASADMVRRSQARERMDFAAVLASAYEPLLAAP